MSESKTRLLNQSEVAALAGVGCVTIRRWRKDGKIPEPVIERKNRRYWAQSDIRKWLRTFEDIGGHWRPRDSQG